MRVKILNFGLPANLYPKRQHYNDAGADVYSPFAFRIRPGHSMKVPLGFGVCLPDGYMALIYPRSSMAGRDLDMPLPPIDSGYRGQIHAIISNFSEDAWWVEQGDRIGQLVIQPIVLADFVEDLGEERGTGAFASTGR